MYGQANARTWPAHALRFDIGTNESNPREIGIRSKKKKKNESRAKPAGMNPKMEKNASRSKSRQSCQPLGQFPVSGISVIFLILGNSAIFPSSKKQSFFFFFNLFIVTENNAHLDSTSVKKFRLNHSENSLCPTLYLK